jgi:hypothetical protein
MQKLGKKGVEDEIPIVFIVVVMLLVATPAIGGVLYGLIGGESPDETSSKRTFQALVEDVNSIVNSPGVYDLKSNIPFYLSKDYAIAGFSKSEDSIQVFSSHSSGFSVKEGILKKPLSCAGKSCLCLIKMEDINNHLDSSKASCRTFDKNIIFYSMNEYLYANGEFSIFSTFGHNPMLGNYGYNKDMPFSNVYQPDNSRYDISGFVKLNYLKSKDSKYFANLLIAGTAPKEVTYLNAAGMSMASGLSVALGANTFYMDKLDLNNYVVKKDEIYLFIAPEKLKIVDGMFDKPPYSSFMTYLSGQLKMPTHKIAEDDDVYYDNDVVNFRKQALYHLAYRDATDVSDSISRSESPEETLYYFFDYLEWVDNKFVHTAPQRDSLVKQLTASALKKVMEALSRKETYCKEYYASTPFQDCMKVYFINCDIPQIKDKKKCLDVNKLYSKTYPSEVLYPQLIKWTAEVEGKDPDIQLLLYYVAEAEKANDYNKAYQLFLDFVKKKKVKSEEMPKELTVFKDALELSEAYAISEGYKSATEPIKKIGSFDVSGKSQEFSFVVIDDAHKYIYVPKKALINIPEDNLLDYTYETKIDDANLLAFAKNNYQAAENSISLTSKSLYSSRKYFVLQFLLIYDLVKVYTDPEEETTEETSVEAEASAESSPNPDSSATP